jgi:signal peptidase I
MVGLPGSGKTTRACELKRAMAARRLSVGGALLALIGLLGCGGARNITNVTVVAPTTTGSTAGLYHAPNATPAPNATESTTSLYRVPSQSMAPTLTVGQKIAVSALTTPPHVEDIVVFHPPQDAEQQLCGPTPHLVPMGGAACQQPEPRPASIAFIKRVVAGPGDEIYISEGHVYRKPAGQSSFIREPDSYIKPCPVGNGECTFRTPIKIAPGYWFLLGDNRGESDDSRFWGPVPTAWIVGVTH